MILGFFFPNLIRYWPALPVRVAASEIFRYLQRGRHEKLRAQLVIGLHQHPQRRTFHPKDNAEMSRVVEYAFLFLFCLLLFLLNRFKCVSCEFHQLNGRYSYLQAG